MNKRTIGIMFIVLGVLLILYSFSISSRTYNKEFIVKHFEGHVIYHSKDYTTYIILEGKDKARILYFKPADTGVIHVSDKTLILLN